ncbi:MAG: VOC family protein [Candidatus Hodarchaeota archaeon]
MVSVCVIGVYVHDMDQALDFYCNLLGFKIRHTYDNNCLVHLENDGPALILEKTENPSSTKYPQDSQIALGIETKNLEETYRKLTAKGVRFLQDTPQRFPAGLFMTIQDPSGNIIEFLEFQHE